MTVIHIWQYFFYGGLWATLLGFLFNWGLGWYWGWGVLAGYGVYTLWVIVRVLRGPERRGPGGERYLEQDDDEPAMSGGVNLVHLLTFLIGGGLLSWGLFAWLDWRWWVALVVGYLGFPVVFFLLGVALDAIEKPSDPYRGGGE